METLENGYGRIHEKYCLSPERKLSDAERKLVWEKPPSHRESDEELRICGEVKRNWHRPEMKIANILLEGDAGSGKTQLAKALSADFELPYTKVTCFADMDKTDVIGAILPVISPEKVKKLELADQQLLKALYESDGFLSAAETAMEVLGVSREQAALKVKHLLRLAAEEAGNETVEYRFYPSEIVRAYKNGYLLEIQEPTVIRDAAVLMALNSALEPDGSINLPTEIVRRHPDFIAVITTNRGYTGCRPLNEALRDRVQHTEKMDLPSKEVMVERAIAKTGYRNQKVLDTLAEAILLLDKTARANAIKGVAGMRSYFYWADAVAAGASPRESLYHKVIYKITTDSEEIKLLEDALERNGLLPELDEIENEVKKKRLCDAAEMTAQDGFDGIDFDDIDFEDTNSINAAEAGEADHALQESAESESEDSPPDDANEPGEMKSSDLAKYGSPRYHQANPEPVSEEEKRKERDFRKELNREARQAVSDSIHKGVKLIIHRPEYTPEDEQEYAALSRELMPIVREIARKTLPLLEHEVSAEYAKNRYYGSRFEANSVAYRDFRTFAKKRPPEDSPSLTVGIRVDESASMAAFGRLVAAKRAVIAVYEFCLMCGIPVLIYGDTADASRLEQMSVFAYADFDKADLRDRFRLMEIRGRSNNRDGMALRILADRLLSSPTQTKLLVSISDGQPKAMDNYAGSLATRDIAQTISEYERKGVTFLAAAIGQDKDVISGIYGQERFLDITDLKAFPAKLVRIFARYL